MKRKDFIKLSSASALFLGFNPGKLNSENINESYENLNKKSFYMGDYSAPKLNTVKVAFIGVGARGSGHLKQISLLEGTEVVGISDLYKEAFGVRPRGINYSEWSVEELRTEWKRLEKLAIDEFWYNEQ